MTVMMTAACAYAQAGYIKGTVVSATDNEPLMAASVVAADGTGVTTNLEGQFSIKAAPGTTATVSYVGYLTANVTLTDGMVVKLVENNTLGEVVVTGYGSAKKLGSFVGAAAVVKADVIENTPSSNFVDALQGQVAGLAIFSNTGEPSSSPANINLRGISSLELASTPLFILDGAPVSSAIFTSLNPSDIESVTVLKDAASTAIYGARAANGVIVITSKKGKMGEQGTVTIRANVGWSEAVQSKIEMMNSQQYLSFRDRMTAEAGLAEIGKTERRLIELGLDTDWRKEFFGNKPITYSLEGAIQGGSEKSDYYLSIGHYDQDGLVAHSGLRRNTLRASFNANLKPWLKVGFSGNFSYEKYQSNSTASYAGIFYMNGPIFQAYALLPYDSPVYYRLEDDQIKYTGQKAQWYPYTWGGTVDANYVADLNTGSTNQITANATVYEQITPIKGLILRAQQNVYAYDRRGSTAWNATEDYTTPMGLPTDFGQYTSRLASESFARMYQFTYTNTAEYNFNINNVHDFTFLLGQESIITRSNSFGIGTSNQPSNDLMLITNGTTVTMDDVSQAISQLTMNSYFFNFDYNYDERYYFNASVRRDGSSKFAPKHRWGTFYAIGAMWNIKKESFLAPVTWIDQLQYRINFGTAGNTGGIGNYDWRGVLAGTTTPYNGMSGMGLASASNKELTWETVQQFSTGVNYSFLNRIYGSIDFYIKDTKDMLMDIPYSVTTGWASGPANVASLRNKGVDFEFGAHLYQDKDWYVGVSANFNYNKNTVTELFNGLDEYKMEDYGLVYKIGENPFQLNTVRYVGVDPRDGKCIWLDKDGNETKVYSKSNAVNTGKSYQAPWNGGFGVNARWKGLSLRADFNWTAEKYIFNWAYQQLCNPTSILDSNQSVKMLETWTPDYPQGTMPAITEAIQADSRYLENTSFVRLKNLTIAYTLPKAWLKKMYMNNITFHFTGRNLLTWSNKEYTGQDPEYVNNGVRFNYPNTRQYEFGVEVSF